MKKVVSIVLSIIFSILSIVTFSLCVYASKENTFIIENIDGKNYIDKLVIGETEYSKTYYANEYNLKTKKNDKGEIEKLIFSNNKKIKIKISQMQNILIYFSTEDSGKVKIQHNAEITEIALKSEDDSNLQYFENKISQTDALINQFKSFTIPQCVILVMFFALLTLIYYYIINKIKNTLIYIKYNDLKIRHILLLASAYFMFMIFCMLPIIEALNKWYFVVILVQTIALAIYFKDSISSKLYNVFGIFAIILTINMAILLPPFHVPDEFAHYVKAYSIFHQNDMVENQPVIKLHSNLYTPIHKYNCNLHSADYKTTIKEYYVDSSIIGQGTKGYNYDFGNTYYSNVFSYLPSAIIIKLCMILNLPLTLSALLGRIINAIIFIIFGYLALKTIPIFKKILFIIMLFPITIQQVTAINQDSLTISIFFLLISIIFANCEKKKLGMKSIILISLLSIGLGFCKPGYFVVSALTLIIPKDNYNSKKQMWIVRLLPMTLCLLATATRYLSAPLYTGSIQNNMITMDYALHHIPEIAMICIRTIATRIDLDLLTGQLNLFGWSTVCYSGLASFIIYTLYVIITFFDNFNEKEKQFFTKYNRPFIVLLSLALIGIIYASALFGFQSTTIGSYIISGLQSRYFIPATCLLAMGCSNNIITVNLKNKNMFIVGVIIFTFAVCFYTIINGFYI